MVTRYAQGALNCCIWCCRMQEDPIQFGCFYQISELHVLHSATHTHTHTHHVEHTPDSNLWLTTHRVVILFTLINFLHFACGATVAGQLKCCSCSCCYYCCSRLVVVVATWLLLLPAFCSSLFYLPRTTVNSSVGVTSKIHLIPAPLNDWTYASAG